MDCSVCAERFDGRERVPKVLACGHTTCLRCLRRLEARHCPTCRLEFTCALDTLATNFTVLQLLKDVAVKRPSHGWCSVCTGAASPNCWDEHDVLSARQALRRHLQVGLRQVTGGQLKDLLDQCQDDEAVRALTLLTGDSWDLTLRGGGRVLTGTLRNTGEDPLVQVAWLIMAGKGALKDEDAPPVGRVPRVLRELSVWGFDRHTDRYKKEAAMQDAKGVERLVHVSCRDDPAWKFQLLQLVAPSLEELQIENPGGDHMRLVHTAMPRLRRLQVYSRNGDVAELPVLPSGHGCLQWLCVWNLPPKTLQSVLRHHKHSLEVLSLSAGSNGRLLDRGSNNLAYLLKECDLRALRRLMLIRAGNPHWGDECANQLTALRQALPHAEVQCVQCAQLPDPDLITT